MDDLKDLLSLLSSYNVEFLIIGAHAVAFHGYPRATKDVDVWVRREAENARRLAAALREFGAAIGDAGATKFATSPKTMVRIGVPPHMVDILNFGGSDQNFEEVWEGRVQGELLGVSVCFPSKVALIEMKRSVGRPQDLLDIKKIS